MCVFCDIFLFAESFCVLGVEYMAALTTARQSDEAETHWLVIGLLIGFLVAAICVIVILAVIAVIL